MSFQSPIEVAVYRSTSATLADKNVVPAAVTLIKKRMKFNIQEGTAMAQDEATLAGIDPTLAAIGYAPITEFGTFDDRDVLLTPENRVFVVVSEPARRKQHGNTDHVRCLLRLSKKRPDGLPAGP